MGLEVEFTEQGPTLPAPGAHARRSGARVASSTPARARRFVLETIRLLARQAGRHAAHRLRGRAVHRRHLRHRGQDRQELRRDQEVLLPRARDGAPPAGAASPRRRATTCWRRSRPARRRSRSSIRGSAWSRPRTGTSYVLRADQGAGRRRARQRRAGHLLRQRRDHDPRPHRRRRRRRLRHRLAPAARRSARAAAAAGRRAVQGNLDPAVLLGPIAERERRQGAQGPAGAAAAATSSTWATASSPRPPSKASRHWSRPCARRKPLLSWDLGGFPIPSAMVAPSEAQRLPLIITGTWRVPDPAMVRASKAQRLTTR